MRLDVANRPSAPNIAGTARGDFLRHQSARAGIQRTALLHAHSTPPSRSAPTGGLRCSTLFYTRFARARPKSDP